MDDDCIKEFLHPDWTDKHRVHNWKNYIPDELKQLWESFTDVQKIAIGKMAERQAGNERWE